MLLGGMSRIYLNSGDQGTLNKCSWPISNMVLNVQVYAYVDFFFFSKYLLQYCMICSWLNVDSRRDDDKIIHGFLTEWELGP